MRSCYGRRLGWTHQVSHAFVEPVHAAHIICNPLVDPHRPPALSGAPLTQRKQPETAQWGGREKRRSGRLALLAGLAEHAQNQVERRTARIHIILDIGAEGGKFRILVNRETEQNRIALEWTEPERPRQRFQGGYPACFRKMLAADRQDRLRPLLRRA